MLSQTLKEQTLPAHRELEKKLVAKMRDLGSLADYAKLLQLFHTYFGALEQHVSAFVDETILPSRRLRPNCPRSVILHKPSALYM
jgi:heme oxygenase